MSAKALGHSAGEVETDSELRTVASAALNNGWTVCTGNLPTLVARAGRLGWRVAGSRLGTSGIETLHSIDQASAHPNSMSARVGRSEQPLHSDGAHHRVPPNLVCLASEIETEVPTFLWALGREADIPWEALEHGLFSVRGGSKPFLSSALRDGLLRFDPICMTPEDARARESSEFLLSRLGRAVRHEWQKPRQILVIDNRRVLHARGRVPAGTHRSIGRVAFHLPLKEKTP